MRKKKICGEPCASESAIGYHGDREANMKAEAVTVINQADSVADIIHRGKEIYEREIRPKIGTGNDGKALVIDVETGDYEMDDDSDVATRRLLARHPDAPLYRMCIGYPAFGKIGGSWGAAR
jgi:hypothetical protein